MVVVQVVFILTTIILIINAIMYTRHNIKYNTIIEEAQGTIDELTKALEHINMYNSILEEDLASRNFINKNLHVNKH